MKLTKSHLRKIIKEELEAELDRPRQAMKDLTDLFPAEEEGGMSSAVQELLNSTLEDLYNQFVVNKDIPPGLEQQYATVQSALADIVDAMVKAARGRGMGG